jgi:hypothetical protein
MPQEEIELFEREALMLSISRSYMMNSPEHLYNAYVTYDWAWLGTKFGLFYTVKGDTLVTGAGQAKGNFVPNVYATEYGTLNASISQPLWKFGKLVFQAKNLLDPDIEEVYRLEDAADVVKRSYKRGIEFTLGFSSSW